MILLLFFIITPPLCPPITGWMAVFNQSVMRPSEPSAHVSLGLRWMDAPLTLPSFLSLYFLNTPVLFHKVSLWPALAPLLASVRPPTLVNTTCSGFMWSWTRLWRAVFVCALRVCFGKETSQAVKSWNIIWTIGLCDVCLPGLSASPSFYVCACVRERVWSGSLCWPRCSTELMDMHTG